ncbi:endo-1,4-beta-xylanase [Nonomuraea soli]|uniref:Beta-xylanase n=1 Tax=Nonomuraea soli TaxID=1032476 RepID=A0A7W0CNG3_9ACTN|nr:endo-1,4-beta-xylanase [Nonomuraea soli]MBA2894345.1 endo-1,4-beta-xylanase [Nonomuraea soli]
MIRLLLSVLLAATTLVSGDFEDGTPQGWAPRGTATLTVTAEAAHSGSSGLSVTGRSANWTGAALDVLPHLAKGEKYELSVWVKGTGPLSLSLERRLAGTPSYQRLATAENPAAWTQLKATYTLVDDVDFLSVYVESSSGTADYAMDDFTLVHKPVPPIQTELTAVKDTVPFRMGAAIQRQQILGLEGQLLTKHFDSVTTGNQLKWDFTEPREGEFTFAAADELVDFGIANGMHVRGHTLAWHSQTPAWVFENATKEVLLARLERHIRAVMGRYVGKIDTWDVVNEVIDENQPDGLRRSPWFEITGLDYIRTAFRVAHEVDPTAKLVFNDYNTEYPNKREAMYKVVKQLLDEGVPITTVGHQLHVNIEAQPASAIEDTIERFAGLPVDQQVTELDVSVYTDSTSSWESIPEEIIIEQGHRYKDIFDVLRRHAGKLSSVTVWGLADNDTWLSTFPITRLNAPLLFDDQLQAKPAYWGVVDPSRLPPLVRKAQAPEGSPRIDGQRDLEWDKLPDISLPNGGFQLRWSERGISLLATVRDATRDRNDAVTATVDGVPYVIKRSARTVKPVEGGYRAETLLPARLGELFELKIVDAATGAETVWLGKVTPVPAVRLATAKRGTPVVDGVREGLWGRKSQPTSVQVEGASGATAQWSALWDSGTLYVLATVTDPVLSEEAANPWEEDSVEIFVDQGNDKAKSYDGDDGQYRISFTGALSGAAPVASAVKRTATGYVVEAALALADPAEGALLGFDLQVNDATGASRTAAATWNDPTGQSYRDTSRWGVLRLVS